MSATPKGTEDLFATNIFNDSAELSPLEGFNIADLQAAEAARIAEAEKAEQAKKAAAVLASFELEHRPLFGDLEQTEAVTEEIDDFFADLKEDKPLEASAEIVPSAQLKFECSETKPRDESVEDGYSINEQFLSANEINTLQSSEQKPSADAELEEFELSESDEAEEKSGLSTAQKVGIGLFIGCAAAVGLTLLFVCPPVGVAAAAVVAAKFLGPAIIAAGHAAISAIAGAAGATAGVATGTASTVTGVATSAASTVAGVATGAASTVAGVATGAASTVAGVATGAASTVAGVATGVASTVSSAATSVAGLASSAMTKAATTFMAAPPVAKLAITATAGVAATATIKKGMKEVSSLLSKAVDGAKGLLASKEDTPAQERGRSLSANSSSNS